MNPAALYFVCILGAAALFVALRPGRRSLRTAAGLAGLGAFVWLLLATPRLLGVSGAPTGVGGATEVAGPDFFFGLFALIAVAAAARMITHHRPVYSALYFVIVVLSAAALFLMLHAEFMAFALVIVYAGAILITYMFVIMLAQQSPLPDQQFAQAEYDVNPREPGIACAVGFVMLAVLSSTLYSGLPQIPGVPSASEAQRQAWESLNQMPGALASIVSEIQPGARPVEGARVEVRDSHAFIMVQAHEGSPATPLSIPADVAPGNVQRVGLDLVAKFPVSLELAGVILLMAMFGAVVLARRQIELGEDELREAAGLRKLGFHDEAPSAAALPESNGGGA